MAINACTPTQPQETDIAETEIVVSPQPTQSFYFEALDGLVETQNEIEVKIIDVGKDAQSVFVDICFTLPDNQKDWFVSFDTKAVATIGSEQKEMTLQKIDLIGFEPFSPFPTLTHRCDRLLFEPISETPTKISLSIESIIGLANKPENCFADDISFDNEIIIGGYSCSSTNNDQSNLPSSNPTVDSENAIMGPWVFDIDVP